MRATAVQHEGGNAFVEIERDGLTIVLDAQFGAGLIGKHAAEWYALGYNHAIDRIAAEIAGTVVPR